MTAVEAAVEAIAPRARRRIVQRPPADPVTQYALDVVAGRIVAGRYVRKACERHLSDLADGAQRGLAWHPELAAKAIAFFPAVLRHYKGEWGPSAKYPKGQPVVLEPWEQFIVGAFMGWLRADGTRRFRELYLEVARKNGKTLLAAGLVILLTFFDGEPGAEAYAIATKRDQAKLVWTDASTMIRRSPSLSAQLAVYALTITDESTASLFRPLGRDSGDSDIGTNPYVAVVDELHVLEERESLTSVRTGMAARRQPALLKITTAGKRRESIWHEERTDAVNVIEGRAVDDSLLALIYTLDEGDDPMDEAVWPKANPNLGVSVQIDFLRTLAAKALRSPGVMTGYLQMHMNVPTSVSTRAISIDEWDKNDGRLVDDEGVIEPYEEFIARVFPDSVVVDGGLDLASVKDLCALIFVNRDDDGFINVMCRFWCPEDGILDRSRHDSVPYDEWVRDGWLIATPGNVTDYEWIERETGELAERLDVREIGFDRWNASQLVTNMKRGGLVMIDIPQTHSGLSAGWREIDKALLEHKIRHGGHPILRWMAGNVEVETDSAGNQKPSKAHSTEKIDGMVGLTMAVGRLIVHPEAFDGPVFIRGAAR